MSKPILSAERARELFAYDPETGLLTWRLSVGGRSSAGKPAGTKLPSGYRQVCVDRGVCWAHRVVWLLQTGAWPQGVIDHLNGDKSDNRVVNLRDTTGRVNQENQRRAMATSSTGLLGASPKRGRFIATLKVAGRQLNLGSFDTAQEAHQAYLTAKRELHAGCTI